MSIQAMREAGRAVLAVVQGGRDAWDADTTARAATRHHLAALGAAAGRVREADQGHDPAIPWLALQRFPALLAEPWAVDDEAVWGAAVSLGPLLGKLEALQGGSGPEVA